jgi:hypothetical protein
MRYFSMLALLAATTALGGCPDPDGIAGQNAAKNFVCGVDNCIDPPAPVPTPTPTPTPVPIPAPPPNIGNDVSLSSGDSTIALEKSVLVSQKANPAYSKLTIDPLASTAKFEIDPKSPNSALWPKAKVMEEYLPGTTAPNYVSGSNSQGTITLPGPYTQTYKEYRLLSSNSAGVAADEELQVWNWKYSYGTQYRDTTSGGGDAIHQAWSFGGTRTASASIPVSGTAQYNGLFNATAKTSNFLDSKDALQTVAWSNIWAVAGQSKLTADFASGQFSGVLTPLYWSTEASRNGATGRWVVDLTLPAVAPPGSPQEVIDYYKSNAVNRQAFFMHSDVNLKGTITKSTTTGNSVVGTAEMDKTKGWLTSGTLNPMYAAFFGPNAEEVSGVFNVEAVVPYPIGGFPINDDRRGLIQMSGVFNGQ